MKKFSLFLGLALSLAAVPAFAESRDMDSVVRAMSDNYARHQMETGLAAGEAGGAPLNTLIFVPTFTYTHNSGLTNLGGSTLLSDNGTSKAAGFALVGKRKVSDSVVLTLKYEYSFTRFDGSSMHPAPLSAGGMDMAFSSNTRQNVNSHSVLVAGEKDFGVWGRLSLALIQSFGSYSGHESVSTSFSAPIPDDVDKRNVTSSSRVTVLGLTYVKPFQITPEFTLSPYAGGGITYIDLQKLNDFSVPHSNKHMSSHDWGYDVMGGAIAEYRSGLWTGSLRGGFSALLNKHAVGGSMVRNVAPETTQAGFNIGGDKIVGTFGASISYYIPQTALLSLSYGGIAGGRVQGHTLNLAVIVPF